MWFWGLLSPFHWLGHGFSGFFGFFGALIRFAILGGIITAIVLVVQRTTRSSGNGRREDSALEALRRRYANGEMSKEEYEQKLKDLH